MIEDTDPKSGPFQHGYEATEMGRDPTQGRGKWSENENVEDAVVAEPPFSITASNCLLQRAQSRKHSRTWPV